MTRIERRPVVITRPGSLRFTCGNQAYNLGAGFEARKNQAHYLEFGKGSAVVLIVLGLPTHSRSPLEPEPRQIFIDRGLIFRPAARRIDILDPQQQAPALCTCHLGITQCRQRMAEMQITIRRWCEAENGWRHSPSGISAPERGGSSTPQRLRVQ